MTTTILTGYSNEYSILGEITAPRWRAYADRYGYHFKCVRDYPLEKGHACWQKLRHIIEALPTCDLLFWVGIDCLCTNPQMPLPVSVAPYEIVGSLDWYPGATQLSTDAMLIRNTPTMMALFQDASRTKPRCCVGGYDLTALAEMFNQNPNYRKRLLIMLRRRFQSVPIECAFPRGIPEPWAKGDFIMHATGVSLERRVKIVKKYAK